MRLTCPNCLTEYEVPEAAVAGRTRTLRCAYCGHQWRREVEMPAAEVPVVDENPVALNAAPLIDAPPLLPPQPEPPAETTPAAPFYSARQEAAAALGRPSAPRPTLPKPAPRRRRWPLAVLSLLIVVLVVVLAAHRPIVHAWPASAPFFLSLGLK